MMTNTVAYRGDVQCGSDREFVG